MCEINQSISQTFSPTDRVPQSLNPNSLHSTSCGGPLTLWLRRPASGNPVSASGSHLPLGPLVQSPPPPAAHKAENVAARDSPARMPAETAKCKQPISVPDGRPNFGFCPFTTQLVKTPGLVLLAVMPE